MFRMPTAVLMMIGQIAVMKITKIADGWPSRNAASDSGSQASGGIVRSTWNSGSSARIAHLLLPISTPSAMPAGGGERVAERHALQRGEQVPEQSLVVAAVVVERIDDELPGVRDHLAGRRQGRSPGDEHRSCHSHAEQREHEHRRQHDARDVRRAHAQRMQAQLRTRVRRTA